MKVYLSSTFLDLQDHREKVAKALNTELVSGRDVTQLLVAAQVNVPSQTGC
jgi:hypothetical protein